MYILTESDRITQEVRSWLSREIDSLSNNAVRLALLSIIGKYSAAGGIYGYAIGEELVIHTKGELDGKKATFYATIRKFEKDGLVDSELKDSPIGPKRKHYFLTEKGQRALQALYENWNYYCSIIKELQEEI